MDWITIRTSTEAAMSSVNEYLDKCLAECPEGAEDLLLGEIAKRVLQKYRMLDRIEVRDRDGVVGYLMPAFIDIEDLPPDLREIALRETDPNEPGIPLEEFQAQLRTEVENDRRLLEESLRTGTSS
jgi:hypothetical protein